MIPIHVISPEQAVQVAVALVLVSLLVVAWRRAQLVSGEIRAQQARLASLENELRALLSCSRAIGERVGDAERSDRELRRQIDRIAHSQVPDQGIVEQAMKLLRAGQPLDEVIRICDLTQGEVEILQSLVRHQRHA